MLEFLFPRNTSGMRFRPGVFRLLALTLLASTLAVVTASVDAESTAEAAPGDCPTGFYQVLSGQLNRLEPTTGVYQGIGPVQDTEYNAMAYRRSDGVFYAVSGNDFDDIEQYELMSVDPDSGALSGTGLVLNSWKWTGDIDPVSGDFFVAAGASSWERIDLDDFTATDVDFTSGDGSARPNIADIAFIDGVGYGVVGTDMARWNLDTMTWETVGASGLDGYTGIWGSTWVAGTDRFYASNNNTGDVFLFEGIEGNSPTATKIADAQVTNSNDGASCPDADDPFEVDAVDDTARVSAKVATAIDVLANDTAPAGSTPEPIGGGSAAGAAFVNDDGKIVYTPPASEANSTVTLNYELCPGEIESGDPWCDTATVSIEVLPPGVDPLECWTGFFQVLSGRLHRLEPTTGVYEAIGGPQPAHYNAMAYRAEDGVFYAVSRGGYAGIAQHELITVDPKNGVTSGTGLVLSSGKYVGDIDPDTGLMWVAQGGRNWQVIDLDTLQATAVNFTSGDGSGLAHSADVSFIDGVGYGVRGDFMVRWNLDTLTWERVDVDGLEGMAGAWGSTWIAGGNGFYAANNQTGEVFVFSNITTDNPSAQKIADAQETNSNDGASCPDADDPFGVDAVDDIATVTAGFPKAIDVLANDTAPAGSTPEAIGGGTATGSVATDAQGRLVYTAPESEVSTTVTLNYELCPGEIPAGHPWCDTATVTINVQPATSYPLPQTIQNCATVTAESAAGDVDDTDCTNVTVGEPLFGRKRVTAASVPIGGQVDFRFTTRNRGQQTIEGVTYIDEIPAEFEPTRFYTGRWSPSSHEVTYEYRIGDTWSTLGTFTGASGAWYNLPDGVEAIRADFGDVPAAFRTRGDSRVRMTVVNPDREGNLYGAPVDTQNCASWSATNFSGATSCANVHLFPPAARPLPAMLVATPDAGPTADMLFVLTVRNANSAQLDLEQPFLIDHLPANLEYVSWRPLSPGTQPTLTVTDDVGSPGRSLLRWDFTDDFAPGQYYQVELTTRIKPTTPAGQYLNRAVSSSNSTSHLIECAGPSVTDTDDLDGDGDTLESLCSADGYYGVVAQSLTEARMVVRGEPDLALLNATTLLEAAPGECPDFDGYTYYPCVAQTRSLGNTDYRLEVENQGNIALDDFVLYNTLPYVGDTGVWEATMTTQRESEWRPTLVAPLSVISAPTGSTIEIEYSYASNPCRPEVSIAGNPPGTEWPLGCVDDWTDSPADIDVVQAVRITVDFAPGTPFTPGDDFVIGYDMKASHGSPFAQEIGWTSFAYTSVQADSGVRNLPSEPRKTGMVIRKPDNGIGDFVWLDTDRDGIQDPGEPGMNGIAVSLYRYDAGSEVLVDTTYTDYLQGDVNQPGHYFFGDQFPGTYFLVFELPRLGWNQGTPDQGGDDSLDSDGAELTMRTPDIVLGEKTILLGWDQGYIIPGGPLGCDEGSGSQNASSEGRRHENDPRPCPM